MNDVPVVAAPPARDHAPPERGQEPAPSDAFAAALGAAQPAEAPPPAADPTARTAPAEGTKAEGDSSGPDTKKPADATAQVLALITLPVPPAQAAAPEAPSQAAATAAPALAAVSAAAGVRVAPAEASAVPATAPVAAAPPPKAPGSGAPAVAREPAPVAAEAASPGPKAPPAAQPTAQPSTQPATTTAAQPEGAPAQTAEAAAPAEAAAAAEAPAAQAPKRAAPARTARADHAGGRSDGPDRPQHTPAAGRPAHVQDAPPAGRTAPPAQTADAPVAAPAPEHAAAPAVAQTPASARAAEPARLDERPVPDQPQQDVRPRVRLRDVPDMAHATLRVAVRQNGGATARISLHPADLGGVRITMRVHDGTVAATLAAETPAAAQELTQTASDLRRSLESQGLQITSLDVHVAGDGPASNGERRQASDLAQAMGTTDLATSEEDVVDITTELHLVPLGTQVDVLA